MIVTPAGPALRSAAQQYISACGIPRAAAGRLYVDLPWVYEFSATVPAGPVTISNLKVPILPRAEFWLRAVEWPGGTDDEGQILVRYGRSGYLWQNVGIRLSQFIGNASFRKLVMPQQRFIGGSKIAVELTNQTGQPEVTIPLYFEGVERYYLDCRPEAE